MILYLDTSALVKRYFLESYSEDIISHWKKANQIVTSSVAYAEIMASVCRKKNESKIEEKIIQEITEAIKKDWNMFIRVEVTDDLNDRLDAIIKHHALRGFDSIHLASALIIRERLTEDFLFACFDKKLNMAARNEGLETISNDI